MPLKLMLKMKFIILSTMLGIVRISEDGINEEPTGDGLDFGVGHQRRKMADSTRESFHRRRHGVGRRRRRGAGLIRPSGNRLGRRRRARRPTDAGLQLAVSRQHHRRVHEHPPLDEQRPLPLDDDPVQLAESTLVVVVDEVAARSVRAQAGRVVRLAEVRLVLGVASDGSQFDAAMRELTLVAVLARAVFGERATQLGLVAAERALAQRRRRRRKRFAGTTVNRVTCSLPDCAAATYATLFTQQPVSGRFVKRE